MIRRVAYLTAGAVAVALVLAGCATALFGEKRAAWRNAEERACVVRRHVRPNQYIERVSRVRDRGACGISRPLKVSAIIGGRVSVGPSAVINCPMTAALESWMYHAVQPAAVAWFGQPVVSVNHMGTYACRRRNNESRARLSEHAFGNAIDISGFKLADGRVVTIKRDWNGDVNARSFLREAFAAACQHFKTVLGPGVRNHSDHFHVDLAHHNKAGTSRYCRPTPSAAPPRRHPIRGVFAAMPEVDPTPTGSVAGAASTPAFAPVPAWPPLPDEIAETR